MEESILRSIAQMLGVPDSETCFDSQLIMHINSALGLLNRIGVKRQCESPFVVRSDADTWAAYLGDREEYYEIAKMYVYLKVKVIFDPPVSTVAMEAINSQLSELEWSINDVYERETY